MNRSVAFDMACKSLEVEGDSGESSSNLFWEIEKQNYQKQVVSKFISQEVQRSIEREFDRWDGILSYRLDQLAEALTLK